MHWHLLPSLIFPCIIGQRMVPLQETNQVGRVTGVPFFLVFFSQHGGVTICPLVDLNIAFLMSSVSPECRPKSMRRGLG